MDDKSAAITHVGWIAVAVKDVQRAEAFYRDVLGLKHLFSFPGMTFFDCGGVRLFLSKPEKPEFDKTPVIYYRVASVDAAFARLQARGAHFTERPQIVHQDASHELWMASFNDSEGNLLVVMEERTKRA